jgi:hypothetical protein
MQNMRQSSPPPPLVSPAFFVRSRTNIEHLLDVLNRTRHVRKFEVEDVHDDKEIEEPHLWKVTDDDFPEQLARLVAGFKALLVKMEGMNPDQGAAYLNSVMLPLMELRAVFESVRMQPEVCFGEDSRSLVVSYVLCVDAENEEQMERNAALLGVLDLLHSRRLDYLRRCGCGQWYIATRTDQEFHAQKCRQKSYAQKPEFKTKRSEWYLEHKAHPKRRRKLTKARKDGTHKAQ